MTEYEQISLAVRDKASYLMKHNPGTISSLIRNSISTTYSLPEYETSIILCKHIKGNDNITILASCLSLTFLEVINRTEKVKTVTLLDHDKNIISVGNKAQSLFPNISIRYIRKNVVFDDISEYLIDRSVIVIPSINMLLPFDDLLPNLPKGTLISATGTNNMMMKYGNLIYNVSDLKSQITCEKVLFEKEYNSSWNTNSSSEFKFTTSVVVAKI